MHPPARTPALFRPRRPGPFAALGRAVSWHRRKLAVLAAIAAVLCTVSALSPAEPASVPVVVTARDLDGGRPLAEADLTVARFPAALAPADAIADPGEVHDRVLITSVGAGTPVTRRSVVAPRGFTPGAGQAMVPVRLDDPAVVGLLRVGDVIDVLATAADGSPAREIAVGARILAFPDAAEADGPLGVTAGSGPGRLVLLETSTTAAAELVRAQGRDRLAVILR
ncbi:MAG: SAF domain-containing protein [Propionibacteriaceae bacterium]|nr:SAF domain-containing protein [Propionibacteriaceae bacterium]